MRLLFDQNLSHRLVRLLAEEFPRSEHTSNLELERADDRIVWDRALADGFMIASKDADFLHLALLRGQPPRVV
jgi:predicted nuclease of predicted toxin-antitoxin system